MRTKLKVGLASRLSKHETRQCLRLSFGQVGSMYWRMRGVRQNKEWAHTLRLFDEHNKLLAWALVFDEFAWCDDEETEESLAIYIYTRASERRKGYGLRLLYAATKRFGQLVVYPHDEASWKFFDGVEDVIIPDTDDDHELFDPELLEV